MSGKKVLCVYYSRTGKTRSAMTGIAQALNGELLEITDGVKRNGLLGAARSCLDAVRKSTRFLDKIEMKHPIAEYDLVILGTPVWAGRCSSIMREFLKKYGRDLKRVAYVITRASERVRYEQVYEQMDLYTAAPHLCAVSLRGGDEGEMFWREEFIKEVNKVLIEE